MQGRHISDEGQPNHHQSSEQLFTGSPSPCRLTETQFNFDYFSLLGGYIGDDYVSESINFGLLFLHMRASIHLLCNPCILQIGLESTAAQHLQDSGTTRENQSRQAKAVSGWVSG